VREVQVEQALQRTQQQVMLAVVAAQQVLVVIQFYLVVEARQRLQQAFQIIIVQGQAKVLHFILLLKEAQVAGRVAAQEARETFQINKIHLLKVFRLLQMEEA
jgi:hypothetical protein